VKIRQTRVSIVVNPTRRKAMNLQLYDFELAQQQHRVRLAEAQQHRLIHQLRRLSKNEPPVRTSRSFRLRRLIIILTFMPNPGAPYEPC
jgi:hypothetical protein